jgi:hypothetical protein
MLSDTSIELMAKRVTSSKILKFYDVYGKNSVFSFKFVRK